MAAAKRRSPRRTTTKTKTTTRRRAAPQKVRRAARKAKGMFGEVFTKKSAKAAAVGVAVNQGSALLAPRMPQHRRIIRELGLYGGMVVAAKMGGLGGVVMYAIGSAVADRYLPRVIRKGGMALQAAGGQAQNVQVQQIIPGSGFA